MAITTSPDNIPSPTSGDPYNYVVDMAALADGTQDALTLRAKYDSDGRLQAADGVADDDVATVGQLDARVPFAQEVGRTVVSGAGYTKAELDVTFESGLFSVAPIVIAGTVNAGGTSLSGTALSITASGFTLALIRNDGGVYSGTYSVPWQAVQMASGAAAGGVGG